MGGEFGGTVETLYLRRTTPEYTQAFDLAIASFTQDEGPLLAITSSAVHAVELLKRCHTPVDFAGTGAFNANRFASEARDWAWGLIKSACLTTNDQRYSRMIWAEPEAASAAETVGALRRLAMRGGILNVIASAPLRRFLPGWQEIPPPAHQPLSANRVVRLLSSEGWTIDHIIVFHGPRSIIWSYLARAAGWMQRPDWADRCLFALRSAYREPGWLWPAAPLVLICSQTA